ncbi:hypothetical protein HYC85_007948 [Camellia sinensis]|uniref:non-specific serine/threonine protein kinase n=1 Tax=Camellia sinensis TaxID=4442 RepID=A0A7J7HQD8_CAMSI|nr:hypothetical protein HYC85_007948 [Camellia sinensis]
MKSNLYLPLLILIFHLLLLLTFTINEVRALDTNNTDRQAFLSFKLQISDPQNLLSGWNNHTSTSHCTWFGVSCTTDHNHRVNSIHLPELGLSRTLSPHLSNLSSLQKLNLSHNNFHGQIPIELGRLSLLTHFILAENSITGAIPASLSQCHNLRVINLVTFHWNSVLCQGCKFLMPLGTIILVLSPLTFGNLSDVTVLSLATNNLAGPIPNQIGHLSNLLYFQLSVNEFSGEFPLSIFNISSLVYLSVAQNNFYGNLPSDVGFSLANIEQLYLGQNHFRGSIPESLFNASRIQVLDLPTNQFQGSIPLLRNMNRLIHLNLGMNNLSSTTEQNFHFFESLSNCTLLQNCKSKNLVKCNNHTKLKTKQTVPYASAAKPAKSAEEKRRGSVHGSARVSAYGSARVQKVQRRIKLHGRPISNKNLILNSNQLSGELPVSLANLSAALIRFCIDDNLFTGSFPIGIEKFQNLISLSMEKNFLTGLLPPSIGALHKLQRFSVHRNKFSGEIPDVFGNLTELFQLTMRANEFSGKIPTSIGRCQRLTVLVLAWNSLVGTIPMEIFRLLILNYLYLERNSLNGSLPVELGSMTKLEFMDISDNRLSGNLPETIQACISKRSLNVSRNHLTGFIPKLVGKLVALESLDLSLNSLSGLIPEDLEKLLALKRLNLSFNDLEGQVPRNGVFINLGWNSFQGNSKLCGNDQDAAQRLKVPIIIVLVSSIVFMSAMFLTWVLIFLKKKKMRRGISSPSIKGLPPKISYSDIQLATNGFAADNLVGKGSFGLVNKGVFGMTTMAVKVIDLKQSKALKTFNAECEALRNIRHKNLVRVITSCSSIDHRGGEFKALLMEFMSNGNLDKWLHPKESDQSQRNLSLTQRFDIAIDIASAIDYLHHDCEPPVVHSDLKPPNVS